MELHSKIDVYKKFIETNPEYEGLNRYCNICGFRFDHFEKFLLHPREARCPVCGSLERHRHLAIHLFSIYPFLQGKKILHFAPETIIKNILKDSGAEYFDCDIDPKRATYQVDITNIRIRSDKFDPDASNVFDYIICIHVLEHIVEDVKAMSELYRVLKPGGVAFLAVPCGKKLFEDYSITDPAEREKAFGQSDHVRWYDEMTFYQRLESVGFKLQVSYCNNLPPVFSESLIRGVGSDVVLARK